MIKIKEIYNKFFKQPVYLFLFLFLIDLIIGGVLFWQVILSPKSDDSQPQSLIVLNKIALDKFIQNLSLQEKNFQEIDTQKYPDIFNPPSSASPSASPSPTSTQAQ